MAPTISTPRLLLRGWQLDDAPAALEIYGKSDVARWLSPAMDRISDLDAMRVLLQRWIDEDAHLASPAGRWVMQDAGDGSVIGGVILLPLPPGDNDLEIGWQLRRTCGVMATRPRRRMASLAGHSPRTSTRSSRWSGPATPGRRRPPGATACRGSARPTNTTA